MRLARRPRSVDLDLVAPLRALAVRWPLDQAVFALLLLAAVAHIAVFAGTGLLRALYPYPIDGAEPGALQQVARVLSGQALYVAPTLDYVPQLYGPVYFYVAAPLALIAGSAQFALRATSLLASLGSIGLVTLLVRRETGNTGIALVAGALLAACDQFVDGTMDIGRTDATSLFFMLAAIYAAQRAAFHPTATWRTGAIAGCTMGLSVLTKQSGAAVALVTLVVLAIICRAQLAAYVVALGLIFGAGIALLIAQTGHWPLFYLWELPSKHQILPQYAWRMWGDLLTRFAAPTLIAPFYLVACLRSGDRRRFLFYTAIPLGMIGMAWASQATIRAARNVELPAYAALALLAGLSLHEMLRWIGAASPLSRSARGYVMAAAIGQLVVVLYNPRLVVPYRSDMWAGDRLAATLAALPGPIFAGAYQGYLSGADGAMAPDLGAVNELLGEQQRKVTPEGSQWTDEFAAALTAKRFTYIVVNPDLDGFIVPQQASDRGYKDLGPLFPSGDVYWQWRTTWAPRAELWVRQESSP